MQYFTFVGTTDYVEVEYHFNDSIEEKYKTKFVQEAIINKYNDAINEIFVFCTEKSRKIYEDELRKSVSVKFNKKMEFIEVPFNVSSEIVISEMQKVLKDDFIFDITHSFRNIPITVTLITSYLEYASNYKLKHLYYGNVQTEEIVDLVKQYQHSKLTNDLDSFNKYLKVSPNALEEYKGDEKITGLLQSFENFNHMIEYCEFDQSIKSLINVIEKSRSILKDRNRYILLEPYLKTIVDKFEIFTSSKLKFILKKELIKILLDHNLIQVSITFMDQLIREELIHYYYFPTFRDFDNELVKRLKNPRNDFTPTIYHLSQDLLYELKLRKTGRQDSKPQIINIRKKLGDLRKNPKCLEDSCFEEFYNEIRNVINHGGKIEKNIDVKNVIYRCINTLDKFVREG